MMSQGVKKRLVVLGGTGFVGRHLARYLMAKADLEVLFAVHRTEPAWLNESSISVESFDINDPSTLAQLLEPGCTVINLLRPDGTGWFGPAVEGILGACAQASIGRYIHVSSIDVFGAATDRVATPATLIQPITPYEKEHAAAEELARSNAARFTVIIVRLGAVFGEGGLNVVSFVDEAAAAPGWKLGLRRALYGRRRMHLVGVQRVVRSLVFLVTVTDVSSGELIVVTDDDAPENNFAYLQDVLLSTFGRRPSPLNIYLPPTVLAGLLKVRGISNSNPMRRFQDNRLAELGLPAGEPFSYELANYIVHLRDSR